MNQNWLQPMLMFGLTALVCLQLISLPSLAQANSSPTNEKQGVQVYLNGKLKSFSHRSFLSLNHTMVPVREFLEEIGAEVLWNRSKRTISASKNQDQVTITLQSRQAKVNGKKITLPVPVQVIQGKAFAPLRVLAEAFGDKVQWDASDRSAHIHSSTSLSTKDAENLVRKKLKLPRDSKTIVEYDHDEAPGIYVIHVYDIIQHSGQPGMTATQGWYTVDAVTGLMESMF